MKTLWKRQRRSNFCFSRGRLLNEKKGKKEKKEKKLKI